MQERITAATRAAVEQATAASMAKTAELQMQLQSMQVALNSKAESSAEDQQHASQQHLMQLAEQKVPASRKNPSGWKVLGL